jgi:hypothetical protein
MLFDEQCPMQFLFDVWRGHLPGRGVHVVGKYPMCDVFVVWWWNVSIGRMRRYDQHEV